MLSNLQNAVEKKGWLRLWLVVGIFLMVLSLFGGSEGGFFLGLLAISLGWVLRWVVRGFT